MGTLASELGPFAEGFTSAPRVYADANLPAGLVRFMRERLHWDVLFVMEEESLRRARDIEHFRLAVQLRRTLVTLDQDFLDDGEFPAAACSGIVVLSASTEDQFERLLRHIDRALFPKQSETSGNGSGPADRLPLAGRKLHVHAEWNGELGPHGSPGANLQE
jgi:predicted nuclease of predicted toxin-antitoxin system